MKRSQFRQDECGHTAFVRLHRHRLAIRPGELPVRLVCVRELKTHRGIEPVVVARVHAKGIIRSQRLAKRHSGQWQVEIRELFRVDQQVVVAGVFLVDPGRSHAHAFQAKADHEFFAHSFAVLGRDDVRLGAFGRFAFFEFISSRRGCEQAAEDHYREKKTECHSGRDSPVLRFRWQAESAVPD